MALQDQLGKMIGPLPLGAWLAVVGGGLAFALYYQRNNAAATAADASTPMDDTTTDSGTSIPAGYGYVGDTGDTGTPTSPAITDNDSWAAAAMTNLVAHGLDPLASSSAISKYLAGEKLNAQEAALVRRAIQSTGSPPSVPTTPTPAPIVPKPAAARWVGSTTGPGPVDAFYEAKTRVHAYDATGKALSIIRPQGYDIIIYQWGRIGSTVYGKSLNYYYPASALTLKRAPKPGAHKPAPKPVVKPKPKPAPHHRPTVHQRPKAPAKPKVRTYVVKRGDTLTSIAHHYHLKSWRSIANANKNKINNPNHIEVGWRLIIPNS